MKKIISTVILAVLVLGLLAPMLATAQSSTILKEFCTMKQNMAWKSGRICQKAPGADTAEAGCDADTYGPGDCITGGETNCALETGDTIGPTYATVTGYDTADPPAPNAWVSHYTDEWGMICLVNTVYNVTNWIFYLLMVIVVVMVVIGGATYMLASGDPERAGKGKSIIIYGIVGLVIALLARLIPSVVKLIVGMG